MTASAKQLGYGAVAIAVGALLLSSWQVWRSGRDVGAAPGQPCACAGEEMLARLSAMERRLGAAKANPVAALALQNLVRRVGTLESRAAPSASSGSSGPAAAPAGDADDDTLADGSRRYVRFDVPERALSVRQLDNGALSVTNTDPSLTHRTVVIKAITDSGTVHDLTITVPAPP